MSRLVDILADLELLDEQERALGHRKRQLEYQSWMLSGRVVNRAYQLFTQAALSLLTRSTAVDVASLRQQVKRLARDGDRFAVELCEEWLESRTKHSSARDKNGSAATETGTAVTR